MNLKQVKIKSKKSIGVRPVYDLCVPDEHHYILENGIVSHNSGFVYASSIVIAMKKLKLKEDEDGNKVSDVRGIRAACKVVKSRYAKPFESVQVKIPWDGGMDPYSGLVELFEKSGKLTKQGNRLRYVSPTTGEEIIEFRKNWTGEKLDIVMADIEGTDLVPLSDIEAEAAAEAKHAAMEAAEDQLTDTVEE